MYAVIKTGGKQYKVAAGEKIKVEQLAADVGETITIDQVFAIGEGADMVIGAPRPPKRSEPAQLGLTCNRNNIRKDPMEFSVGMIDGKLSRLSLGIEIFKHDEILSVVDNSAEKTKLAL